MDIIRNDFSTPLRALPSIALGASAGFAFAVTLHLLMLYLLMRINQHGHR